MAKQKLSVCMIVKNEERFLADCLSSVQSVADQIVVVDTGSTDRTIEIARQYGAEIHFFEWHDDFAAARNASLQYAKGDWILWLDADERLMPESAPELKRLIRPERTAVTYLVSIKNVMNDGKTFRLTTGHRLFNNRRNIYFEGRIHEQIIFSVERAGGEERLSHITLYHLGYGLGNEEQAPKKARNRQLLLKMLEENPSDAYTHFTLGQNYYLAGENENALKHYLIALRKNRFPKNLKTQLLNTISAVYFKLNKLRIAQNFATQSIRINPNQISGYYLLYRIAEKDGRVAEARRWIKTLREKNRMATEGRWQVVNDHSLSDMVLPLRWPGPLNGDEQQDEAERRLNKMVNQNSADAGRLKRPIEVQNVLHA